MVKPDGDPQYEKFKELHFRQYADITEAKIQQKVGLIEQETKAQQMILEAQGIAEKRKIEGYTYQQERGFDVAEGLASNEGAGGNLASMGIGLGVMAGVGNTIGGVVNNAIDGAIKPTEDTNNYKFCSECGAKLSLGAKFCDQCGAKQNAESVCSNCGYKFTKDEKFCPNCGTKKEV